MKCSHLTRRQACFRMWKRHDEQIDLLHKLAGLSWPLFSTVEPSPILSSCMGAAPLKYSQIIKFIHRPHAPTKSAAKSPPLPSAPPEGCLWRVRLLPKLPLFPPPPLTLLVHHQRLHPQDDFLLLGPFSHWGPTLLPCPHPLCSQSSQRLPPNNLCPRLHGSRKIHKRG